MLPASHRNSSVGQRRKKSKSVRSTHVPFGTRGGHVIDQVASGAAQIETMLAPQLAFGRRIDDADLAVRIRLD